MTFKLTYYDIQTDLLGRSHLRQTRRVCRKNTRERVPGQSFQAYGSTFAVIVAHKQRTVFFERSASLAVELPTANASVAEKRSIRVHVAPTAALGTLDSKDPRTAAGEVRSTSDGAQQELAVECSVDQSMRTCPAH